jgi:hypothetical protein
MLPAVSTASSFCSSVLPLWAASLEKKSLRRRGKAVHHGQQPRANDKSDRNGDIPSKLDLWDARPMTISPGVLKPET